MCSSDGRSGSCRTGCICTVSGRKTRGCVCGVVAILWCASTFCMRLMMHCFQGSRTGSHLVIRCAADGECLLVANQLGKPEVRHLDVAL